MNNIGGTKIQINFLMKYKNSILMSIKLSVIKILIWRRLI